MAELNVDRKWTGAAVMDLLRIGMCGALAGNCLAGVLMGFLQYAGAHSEEWRFVGAGAMFLLGILCAVKHKLAKWPTYA